MTLTTTLIALSGGLLPVLLWLWFWLRQDKLRPEPRLYILLSFVGGILVVPLVIPIQQVLEQNMSGMLLVVSWAASEELLKLVAAYAIVLRLRVFDEPIDAVIYLIVVALGFSAAENFLFILNPLSAGDVTGGVLTGSFRFIGATLLHLLSSAAIGIAIALAYCRPKKKKMLYLGAGIILAIVLHAAFNLIIILSNGEKILLTFLVVWSGVVILMLFFEKIKQMKTCRALFTQTP